MRGAGDRRIVNGPDVNGLGWERSAPAATGRPPYDPLSTICLRNTPFLPNTAHNHWAQTDSEENEHL